MVLVRLLQRLDRPLDLVKIAAQIQRVVDDRPDDGLGIDNEHGTDGLGAGNIWLEHPVFVGNLHVEIRNHREIHLHMLHAIPGQFLNPADPGNMGIQGIDG